MGISSQTETHEYYARSLSLCLIYEYGSKNQCSFDNNELVEAHFVVNKSKFRGVALTYA